MEQVYVCPFGNECEGVKEKTDATGEKKFVKTTCVWYQSFIGERPQGDGGPRPEYGCALTWHSVLALENAKQVRGVQADIELLRKEQIATQASIAEAVQALHEEIKEAQVVHQELLRNHIAVQSDVVEAVRALHGDTKMAQAALNGALRDALESPRRTREIGITEVKCIQ